MARRKAKGTKRTAKKAVKDLDVSARKAKGVKGGMSLASIVTATTSTLPSNVKASETGSTATALRG